MASSGSESEGEVYEVDEILDQRKKGRTVEYLVRWKGFGEEEDSWETARNVKAAKEALERFLKKKEEPKKDVQTKRRSTARTGTSTSSNSQRTEKTTTTTKTTVITSADSSPESSPRISRRSIMTKTYEVSTGSNKGAANRFWQRCSFSVPKGMCLTRRDLPIVILVACLLTIAATFVFE